MKFEIALEQFKNEIAKQYGYEAGIVKIGIHPELFSTIMIEHCESPDGKYANFTVEKMGETHICGVQILPRRKDDF